MPGRQVCFYDKRADSLLKRKFHWPAVWGLDLAEHPDPIWRVEARAARDELRDRQRVHSFADLEARLGEIVGLALTKVRYVVPSPCDRNGSRWPTHPLWQAAQACMTQAIEEHAFAPSPARHGLPTPRWIKLDELRRQLVSLAASCGALEGLPDKRAGDLPGLIAAMIRDAERARPGLLEGRLARARARYGPLG